MSSSKPRSGVTPRALWHTRTHNRNGTPRGITRSIQWTYKDDPCRGRGSGSSHANAHPHAHPHAKSHAKQQPETPDSIVARWCSIFRPRTRSIRHDPLTQLSETAGILFSSVEIKRRDPRYWLNVAELSAAQSGMDANGAATTTQLESQPQSLSGGKGKGQGAAEGKRDERRSLSPPSDRSEWISFKPIKDSEG